MLLYSQPVNKSGLVWGILYTPRARASYVLSLTDCGNPTTLYPCADTSKLSKFLSLVCKARQFRSPLLRVAVSCIRACRSRTPTCRSTSNALHQLRCRFSSVLLRRCCVRVLLMHNCLTVVCQMKSTRQILGDDWHLSFNLHLHSQPNLSSQHFISHSVYEVFPRVECFLTCINMCLPLQKKLRKLSNIIEQSICDILLQQQQHENSSAVQAGQPLSPFELAMPPPPPPIKKRQKFVKRITKGIASAMRRLTGRSKESLGPVVTPGHHSLHTLSHTLYNNNLAAKKAAMMGDATPAASSLQSPRTPVDPTKLTGSAVPGQDAMHPPHTPQQQHPLAAPAAGSQSREWTPPGPQVHATNSAMSQAYIMPNSNVQQPTSNNSVSQTTPMSDLSTPLHLHVNKSPHWSQVPSSDGMQPLYPPNTASLTNSQASVSRPPMSAGDTRVLAGGLAGAAGMANAGQAFATGSTQHAGGAHDTMHDLPSGDSVALAGPPQNQMQGAHEMQVSHQYSFRTYVGLACPDVQPSSPKPHYDCSVQRLVGQLSSHTYSPVQEPIGIESEGGCCSMHASAHCEHVPIVEYVRSSLQAIRQAPQHVCQQQQPTPPLQNVQVQYNIVFNDGPESVGDKSSHPPSSEGAATTNSGMPSLPSIATRAHHPLAHQHQHLSSPLGPSSQSPGAPLVHTTAPSTEHETTLSPHSPAPPSMHDVSAGQTTAPPTISSHPSPRTAPSSTDAGSSLPPRHAGWQADVGTQAHLAGPGTEHSSIALSSKGDPTLSSKGDVVLVSQQHSSTQPSGLQSSQRDTHSARSSRKTGQGPVSDFSVGSSEFTSRQFSSVVAGSGLEDAERMVPADALTGEATAVRFTLQH